MAKKLICFPFIDGNLQEYSFNNLTDDERERVYNKELQNEVDYYKHEYYSECDLREKLEKALDKACEVMTNRVNIDRGDGYPTLHFTKEEWKEWCLKDD